MRKEDSGKKIKALKEKIKKKKKPTFRGHFGKRSVRRKSIAKWDKWRYPRGADFNFEKQDGKKPKSGYRTDARIRGVHPSGYRECLVHNVNELEKAKVEGKAVRIAGTVGARKRAEIIKRAEALGLKVLNA